MLILQIIGGWLAISSVCLNVYYFLTIGYQRRLLREYRDELESMRKKVNEMAFEQGHLQHRLQDFEANLFEVSLTIKRQSTDIQNINAKRHA